MADTATAAKTDAPPAGAGRPAGRSWNPTAKLDETVKEIEKLGLQQYVAELDNYGYTIVPPEKIGRSYAENALAAAVRIAEEDSGVKPDLETGATVNTGQRTEKTLFPWQEEYPEVLFRDPAFEQLVLNPVALALVTHLLGEHAELSGGVGVWFRGPVARELPPGFIPPSLHSDNYGVPSPFPAYAQVCNATWALTDYTREGGCLGFIPGSHRLMRHPLTTGEMLDQWVPAEAPAGSLIFWHGNTWHTIGNPRTIPGMRVSTAVVYCRPHMHPINRYTDVPQESLDRNPPRFARLLGLHNRYVVGHRADLGAEGIPGAPSWWE
jgi:ectoine hydroxylase-related dioxygenase (phytanoyl-CoA dioxygenase family)